MAETPESGNPSSMKPSMLVSATYDNASKCAVLKFYEPESQRLFLWKDETGHRPYCYSRLSAAELDFLNERSDVLEIKPVKRHDLMADREISMSKIIVADPLAIGGTATDRSIRNTMQTWESDIKYYENYLYDRSLVVGKYYSAADGALVPHDQEISEDVRLALKGLLWDKVGHDDMVDMQEFKRFVSEWAELLNQPIPHIRRLSIDIEVEAEIGRIPDPKLAEKKVTAIGFKGSGGLDRVFVLRTGAVEGTNDLDPGIQVKFYEPDMERSMIEDAFEVISGFPFLVTYNGDEFDLPYLYNRAERLGVQKSDNPLYMMRDSATLKTGVHLDLYRTLSNRSFQIYAFSQKYTDFSLNSVSKALIGKEKLDYGVELDKLHLYQTANYCYNDALLTYELTSFNNDLLMNLLVIIARIARMPIDDIARMGVSQWIRSLLYYEHRQRNSLIPTRDELQKRSEGVISDAAIKNKKYRGGLVVDPKEGIHFNVTVMDFASLYPSIIKVKNLSYETVRCPHKDCMKNKIPQTNHWACSKKNGLTSIIIGSLRDLRVNYYKSLSRKETLTDQQRQQYTVVSQALKVILNASYGVMGAEIFPLYFLPAAEATTAIGRHTILETIKKCEGTGIDVLYGDSVLGDSPVVVCQAGICGMVPIESLIPEYLPDGRYACRGMSILSDDGLAAVRYAYRHTVSKTGYRIGTAKSYVEVTDDHSLMINGVETRPCDLQYGDMIDVDVKSDMFTDDIPLDENLAWMLGYYVYAGMPCMGMDLPHRHTATPPPYHTATTTPPSQHTTITTPHARHTPPSGHTAPILHGMQESIGIMSQDTASGSHAPLITATPASATPAGPARHSTTPGTTTPGMAQPDMAESAMMGRGPAASGHGGDLQEYLRRQCHAGKSRIVPAIILNATRRTKSRFLDGVMHAAGIHTKNGAMKLGHVPKSVLSGLCIIFEKLDIGYSLEFPPDGSGIAGLVLDGSRASRHNTITYLEKFQIHDAVYDVSTKNGHFRAGIGNILLHNTDSLFLKDPTDEQVRRVIMQAKKDHGVDLEIDKEYRYCVLSNRKKNYLGVSKSGKVDVKGLTGKKSHTPAFIKKLFFELLDVLSGVQNIDEFERAKRTISDKITACAAKVQSREIPLKDLTFNVMISKSPSEYVKTIPQHIRAAKQLESIREVKKGDRISYVKVINKPGVKPLELARPGEIDSKKYMEFMESTLEQITSSMDLDFDTMLGKPKQTGLDEFFWS